MHNCPQPPKSFKLMFLPSDGDMSPVWAMIPDPQCLFSPCYKERALWRKHYKPRRWTRGARELYKHLISPSMFSVSSLILNRIWKSQNQVVGFLSASRHKGDDAKRCGKESVAHLLSIYFILFCSVPVFKTTKRTVSFSSFLLLRLRHLLTS